MSFDTNKFMKRMFRRIDGIVWDIVSGATALKTTEGVFSFAIKEDGTPEITVNPFDMSLALPGFATQTPRDQVAVGDIIVGDKQILGWVVETLPNSFRLLDVNGMQKNYNPPKVAILGGEGPLVVRNLFNLAGGQAGVNSMLPMLMMMKGDDSKLESMLPFLLMQGQTAPAAGAANTANGMNPMMLMMLMKDGKFGGKGGKIDPMMLMMMGGMGGGGMNSMLMMALMDDDAPAAPALPVGRPVSPPPLHTL